MTKALKDRKGLVAASCSVTSSLILQRHAEPHQRMLVVMVITMKLTLTMVMTITLTMMTITQMAAMTTTARLTMVLRVMC